MRRSILLNGLNFLAVFGLVSCSLSPAESHTHIAYGTPLKLGDVELEYTVGVLDDKNGYCTGVVVSPRHVLTSIHCLVSWENLNDEPRYSVNEKAEVLSVSGGTARFVKALKAAYVPRLRIGSDGRPQPTVGNGLFSPVNIASGVVLLTLSAELNVSGLKIAMPERSFSSPLRIIGFGVDENGEFKGPRAADSAANWKSARLEHGYGIIGFTGGTGFGCNGDAGAPAVAEGMLIGLLHWTEKKPLDKRCTATVNQILSDLRYLRGWLKCAARKSGFPLGQVEDAPQDALCDKTSIVEFR